MAFRSCGSSTRGRQTVTIYRALTDTQQLGFERHDHGGARPAKILSVCQPVLLNRLQDWPPMTRITPAAI